MRVLCTSYHYTRQVLSLLQADKCLCIQSSNSVCPESFTSLVPGCPQVSPGLPTNFPCVPHKFPLCCPRAAPCVAHKFPLGCPRRSPGCPQVSPGLPTSFPPVAQELLPTLPTSFPWLAQQFPLGCLQVSPGFPTSFPWVAQELLPAAADGVIWREVQGATSSCQEAAGLVWQSKRGGPHGGLPVLPQTGPQATQVPPRSAKFLSFPEPFLAFLTCFGVSDMW